MIEEVRLPEISENIDSGDVIKVLVSVGDRVDVDDPLVELETDKAVFEVPSSAAGTISEILVAAGETIKVGQAIARIETSGDRKQPGAETAKQQQDTTKAPTRAEPLQSGKDTAQAAARVQDGEDRERSAIVEDTSKDAQSEARAAAGTRPRPSPERAASNAEVDSDPTPEPADAATVAPASPSLRRLARELGVDIRKVRGSGPGGRILRDDLTHYAREVVSRAGASARKAPNEDATEKTKWGAIVREPMSKVRQVTARNMSDAWTTIPHVTQYEKVDITEMEEIRKQYSKRMEGSGGKLTMTAILLKVAASALKVFPQFNASIDMEKSEIVYKRYYNIGVAVDTERGLIVPVIRDVDKKNISELAFELNGLAERTREKKIKPDELEGGTFTISNLGGIGGTNFSPIIYPPQVAIVGVARARIEPVWMEDRFEPRLMLPLSVSYDHRLIDGADAARFARWIVQALEEPLLLALEG